MSDEAVVHQNEMNLAPLRQFTSAEIDVFFSLCNKLREQDVNELTIPFEELRLLSEEARYSQKRFVQDLKFVYDKLLDLTYTERDNLSFKKVVLFTGYKVDVTTETLTVRFNPNLKHVLDDIISNFTQYELKVMTNLKSVYSKNMYRLLKQHAETGYFKITISDFREQLDIPESYRMTHINQKVLTPIIKELGLIFTNLNINKVKVEKGRKIESLEFTFNPKKKYLSMNSRNGD